MTEPTNADILAAIQALTSGVAALTEGQRAQGEAIRQVAADVSGVRREGDHGTKLVRADIAQLRADIAAVKAETAYTDSFVADQQEALRRHFADPDAHGRAA